MKGIPFPLDDVSDRNETSHGLTEADLEMIPHETADATTAECSIERLDLGRIREGIARSSHLLTPLIVELSLVVGEPHGGGYIGGDILGLLGRTMMALASLAERSAEIVMAGRTHGQHAVPITFGLKVASWIDEIRRHFTRMLELEPRLFAAVVGGAAGTFASFGDRTPEV